MIDISKIKNDRELCTFPLAIWVQGSYSIHEISIMESEDENESEYLIFNHISGTSITNWTKNEYDEANKYFDIGDREIIHRSPNTSDINVSNDCRN